VVKIISTENFIVSLSLPEESWNITIEQATIGNSDIIIVQCIISLYRTSTAAAQGKTSKE
jgi:hypothetical protein